MKDRWIIEWSLGKREYKEIYTDQYVADMRFNDLERVYGDGIRINLLFDKALKCTTCKKAFYESGGKILDKRNRACSKCFGRFEKWLKRKKETKSKVENDQWSIFEDLNRYYNELKDLDSKLLDDNNEFLDKQMWDIGAYLTSHGFYLERPKVKNDKSGVMDSLSAYKAELWALRNTGIENWAQVRDDFWQVRLITGISK